MKKILILSGLLICVFISRAQVSDAQRTAALQLVKANTIALGMSLTDISDAIVSGTYQITGTDITMVYLQQSYLGIPVYNQMQVLAFKKGQLVSNAGSRLPGIEKLTRGSNEVPSVSAVQAVRSAFAERNIIEKELAVPVSNSADGHVFEFGRLGVATENIKAELIWLPGENKLVRMAWQVQLAPNSTPDLWLIRIDAKTGSYIDKNNLTVTCNWDNKKHSVGSHLAEPQFKDDFSGFIRRPNDKDWRYRPFIVSDANYTVIKYPAESPQHTGGAPSVHNKPWLLTPGNATSLGWHDDGTVINESTKGNNVWAQEDRDNNNNTFGNSTISTTAQPTLNFPNVYDFTLAPTEATLNNQKAAITNLFYWNNLLHDISYAYGFDELSGNFQKSNQGRGGLGADYVIADAQDAGGTNNANMSTPADGSPPRMQMYLFTSTNPNRDGDLDNGVISHEYTHGISNRLTGGPANSSCLSNAEQGGEGWSDYFSLMTTTNWATATVNDGPVARPIGTYVLGQPLTGAGIRNYPYSTNLAVNPLTYSFVQSSGGEVHNIGEAWCMALWEMTWEIIRQDNAINTNLFVPGPAASMIGNSAALKLVVEGMRLQPCSPGFIDARNAILKADTLFFNKKYSCSIWKAFAKRGMGKNASQGSSNSTSDQVVDFTVDASALVLNTNTVSVPETQNIVYTNKVTASDCAPVNNFVLTDTLPANVTYVSGGSYNSANRVVSFNPVTVSPGSTQAYPFTVTINAGTYFPPVSIINEPVAGATIPSFWTETSTTTTHWTVSSTQNHSSPNSFFTADLGSVSDQVLVTTNSFSLGASPPTLSFWHFYNTESGWDGGVVEISLNGGSTWSDIGAANFISGGYTATLNGSGNPLAGRVVFNGNSGGFIKSTINMTPYANQSNVKIRFRFGSDESVSAPGWYVDDIEMKNIAVVNMRTSLFDASNNRISKTDTVTVILPANGCIAPTVGTITQPTCAVPTGSVVLNDLPATGTWTINPGAVTGTGTSTTISGLAPGTYSFTVVTAVCTSVPSANVVINTSPLPAVDAINNQVVCNNTATTTINFTSPVAGTAFNWTNNNTSIGLAANGSGDIASFMATNTTNAPVTATVTVTPTSSSFAYISNTNSNNVSVINTATNLIVTTIPVGSGPYGVSVSPDGGRVYISNRASATVSVINTTTNSVVATILAGTNPEGLSVNSDGSRVYVANNGSGTVSVINTTTNSVVATVSIGSGSGPRGVSISPDGSRVYVANINFNNISVINTATNLVEVTVPVGSAPFGVSISPDGSRLYVANLTSNSISVINTVTNSVIATIPVGIGPRGVSVSPDGSRVYVANGSAATVSVINTTTNLVVATVSIGFGPFGISVTPDGNKVYAANQSSSTVSVINAATNSVVTTVPVGTNPFALGNFIAGLVCTGSPKTFTITVNPTPVVTVPTITQPTCTIPTGTITVNATGAGVLEYSIDNGSNWQLNSTFSNLAPGSYNIKVRLQGSNCVTTYSGNPVVLNSAACNTKTIPGKIEAESFDTKFGGQYAVSTSDAGGGQQVIGISNGSWMDYNVTVTQTGTYTVNFRIATTQSNAQFQIKLGNTVLGTINIPNTGGWDNWQTVAVNNISLTAGVQTIRILSTNNETCNFNWMHWVLAGGGSNIIVTGALTPFIACPGTASSQQSFTVAGTGFTANLVVTAPSGFEVSTTSGSGFAGSVTLIPVAGTVSSAIIYCRMSASASGTSSGNISCASTGATTVNVAVSGTVNPPQVVTTNANSGPGSLRQAVIDACPGSTITFSGVTSPISLSDGRIIIDKNLTIQGPGASLLTVQNTKAASATSYIFHVNAGVTATISGLTISGGNVNTFNTGGGITSFGNLTVTSSVISNNMGTGYSAPNGVNYYGGGGIFIKSGILNITNSAISNNTRPDGGGIYSVDGTVSLTNSTVSGNTANVGNFGGGIFATGSGSTVNVTNSTFSGNIATANVGGGGGIYSSNGSTVNLVNSTITNNTSNPVSGSGGLWNNAGTVNSRNSIIAGNIAPVAPDYSGSVISQGYNLVGKSDGSTGFTQPTDLKGTIASPLDAVLGPLQDNNGPTLTHALLSGSPAIDKGSAVAGITTDQRGVSRPYDNPSIPNASGGNGSDIGAYEAGPGAVPTANAGPNQIITLPTNQVTLAGSGTANNGGSITAHVWSKFSGGSATITDVNNYGTTVTGLSAGTYVFRLTVTQNDNQAATSDVTITVNPAGGNVKFIPGKIEAESFDTKFGGQYAVSTSDAGGGQQVIGISNGSWMDYNVTVTQTGTYTVNFRIATTQSNAQFQIKLGNTVLGTINIPNTGGWDNWQTVAVNNISLTAGVQTIRILSTNNETCNFNWMDWVLATPNTGPTANAGPSQSITLPTNQAILAGSATANNGGSITSHVWSKFSGGSATITDPNDYGTTVTGLSAGTYVFRLTVTQNDNQTATSDVTIIVNTAPPPIVNAGPNQNITLPINQVTLSGSGTANNGGSITSHVWSKFSGGSATITDVNNYGTTVTGLSAGTYVFRLTVTQNDNQTSTSDVTITVNPAGGNVKFIPGKIEAESFDTKFGGQYAVSTSDAGGGQQVIGISNGSWMDYNVTVTQTGTYTVNFRIATTQSNAQFQIKLGNTVLGTINIPNTGGWDNWQTVAVNNISLTAGVQTIRILSTNNETCNFNWMHWVFVTPFAAAVATVNKPSDIVSPVQKEIKISEMQVSVFPNPAESYFNLKVTSKNMEAVTIRITDIAGRQVQQLQAMPGQTIRFGNKMTNGTYLVEVRQGSERMVTKVVKQ